jgi:hypothetical protein
MESLKAIYTRLKKKLNEDTRVHSNPNMWLRHRAYKAIVALGLPVVPLILGDLQKSLLTGKHEDYPGWWVMYALPEITGDRIPAGGREVKIEQGFAKVSVDDVSRWWIAWGKKKGAGSSLPGPGKSSSR